MTAETCLFDSLAVQALSIGDVPESDVVAITELHRQSQGADFAERVVIKKEDLSPGLVLRCPYTWARQSQDDASESQPHWCVVILTCIDNKDNLVVTVLPIVGTAPVADAEAVKLPDDMSRKFGSNSGAWVVLSQVNTFSWPKEHLRDRSLPQSLVSFTSQLPPASFTQVLERFLHVQLVDRYRLADW